jgi:hypothetical protein
MMIEGCQENFIGDNSGEFGQSPMLANQAQQRHLLQ